MKILYIPLDTAIPEEDDFYLALKKAGHEVQWYWDEAYESILNGFDVIHLQSGAIDRGRLAQEKEFSHSSTITQWTGDYRPEPMEMITQYEGLVDITFMAADVPELYPKENIKWLPHGVGDRNFREVNPDAEGIVMIANNYPQFPGGKEREEMHNLLMKRDDYVCYGSGYEGSKGVIPYRDTPDIYNKFRFAVGCNIYNDVPKYFSNRPLNAIAAGCCFCWRQIRQFDYPGVLYCENENLLQLIDELEYTPRYITENQKWVKDNFHYDNIVIMWENEL